MFSMELDVMSIIDSYPVTRPLVLNGRSRILIVDDHPAIRRARRREFEHVGWEVCGEAANGMEGSAKTDQLLPELVVLDLAMPEMDGLTTARLLKRTFPEVHLTLLTGHGELFRQDEAICAGISAVCSKSESTRDLMDKARSLARHQAVVDQQ
jgi:NarL family two-component system response regulator LiaR